MAVTPVLRNTALVPPQASVRSSSQKFVPKFVRLPLTTTNQKFPKSCYRTSINCYSPLFSPRRHRFLLNPICSASSGETTETREVAVEEIQDNSDSTDEVEDGETASEDEPIDADETASAVIASFQSYREALATNDESKVAEIEAFLKSFEDDKIALESKVATLSKEMSSERDRVLRISADFDNFRKRTERERLSLVTNAKGEVVESLLPVLDNFDRAKTQIKVETEGEEKINNSYQSISKQFLEVLGSLGVVPVETTGNPFDPMLHEAIMREDSDEFEEGIILQEFRKGFKVGDRLLRPAMVKVSAGPGPAKSELVQPSEESEDITESEEDSSEASPSED